MICSVLFHICHTLQIQKKTACFFLSTLLLSAVLICVSAPVVNAEKETRPTSVDSVNLRENQWVYSVYVDKSNNKYAAIIRYDGGDIDIMIPAELGGVPVRVISREAFCNSKYITSVIIPDGVTEIGKYAFSGCIGISNVTFPASLRSIGEGAFYGCRSLTNVSFSDGLKKIGSFAFFRCLHLQSVSLPSTLRSIEDSAFDGCGMLETISFGGGLEKIGDTAFMNCHALQSVDLSGISDLGAGAFMKCSSLKNVLLSDKLSEILPETFRDCGNLESVKSGTGISKIGVSAFEGCTSLKSIPDFDCLSEIASISFKGCTSLKTVNIGSSVSSIGVGAFSGCSSLSKITVSDDNESYSSMNGCLCSKDGTTLILCPRGFKGTLKLGKKVREIDDYAATCCVGITNAILGEELRSVGRAAFLGCMDIASFSMPDSLETMGSASVGFYLANGKLNKAEYVRIYASKESCAEKYCTNRELPLSYYDSTLCVSSKRVVLCQGNSFALKWGFESQRQGEITWSSSDESVVNVNGGKLSAVAAGSAEVTASADGFEPWVTEVIVVSPDEIGTSKEKTFDTRLIYRGESEELSSILSQIIDPIFSANRFWYTSAPEVATVDNDGKVTARGRGTANITCLMPDGSENHVLVTVTEKPAQLVLDASGDELLMGQNLEIFKTFRPSFSTDSVTWESDDESVAVVDDSGRITAVGQGVCNITAQAASGLKSSVALRCVIPAESISLDKETRDVYQGKQFNLKASVLPETSKETIIWRSSDPNVASVNSKGKVTGKSFGSAVIYAETAEGLRAECAVNVLTHAEELKIDVKKLSINLGTSSKLNSIVRPSYSPETTDKCSWNSTNEKVALVDENGLVTAVGPGKCIINCRTGGDLISKCQVLVRLPAASVEIRADRDSIYIGGTQSLEALISPADSTDKLEWFSDNEDVARVTSGGTVKGRSSGKAVITAKVTNDVTGQSITASFEIQVMKKADSVALSKNNLSLNVGENDFIPFTVQPEDSNDTVRWYSTDEKIATVRGDGLITAVSTGTCYICIETGSGVSAKCKLTVN